MTRDFGHEQLGTARIENVREDETVMRMLRSEFDIDTRYGGRFVQSIDGLEGAGAGGERDWFYWVNGVEGSVGAAEFELSPGRPRPVGLARLGGDDARAGDRRRLPRAVRARARGQAPAGAGGVRGAQSRRSAAMRARRSRRSARRPRRASLGAPGTETITRLAVARWPEARIVRGASGLEDGPETTGVFARFDPDGRSIELLDERGEVARTVRPGDGVGIVLAMRPLDEELVWLATGLDERGRGGRRAAPSTRTSCATPLRWPSMAVPWRSFRW